MSCDKNYAKKNVDIVEEGEKRCMDCIKDDMSKECGDDGWQDRMERTHVVPTLHNVKQEH